jgi:hypothetical protein
MQKANISQTIKFFLGVLLVAIAIPSAQAQNWDMSGAALNSEAMRSGGQGNVGTIENPGNTNLQPYIESQNRNLQPLYTPSYGSFPNTSFVPNGSAADGRNYLPALLADPQKFQTSYGRLAPIPRRIPISKSTGLPPTTLDSFVRNAGGRAELIYGDEGTNSWPPQSGFGPAHTIDAGIVGLNNRGLTTGHGSKLPTASGNGQRKSGPR